MKALTLTQPWASLIAMLLKTYETRWWKTSYRGPLLIHASREVDWDFIRSPIGEKYGMPELWTPRNPPPTMAVLALTDLEDCVPTCPQPASLSESDLDTGDWSWDRWAWRLTNIRPLPEPISCRGQMSVWTPPKDILHAVRAAVLTA